MNNNNNNFNNNNEDNEEELRDEVNKRIKRSNDREEEYEDEEEEEELSNEEDEEEKSFQRILFAFNEYENAIMKWLHYKESQYLSLPLNSFQRLTFNSSPENSKINSIENLISSLKQSIQKNQKFLNLLCLPYHNLFTNLQKNEEEEENKLNYLNNQQKRVQQTDIDKVKSTLRIIARDWSNEGAAERDQCYKPILDELESRFPLNNNNNNNNNNNDNNLNNNLNNKMGEEFVDMNENEERYKEELVKRRKGIKVLTPGTGLSRLTWEIANRGFTSQGNEFSFYMLTSSNFILNSFVFLLLFYYYLLFIIYYYYYYLFFIYY